MSLRDAANALLSALLAPPCAVCARVLEHPLEGAVCDRCWCSIVPHPAVFTLSTITQAQALGSYEGTLREVVHALKYGGRRSVAPRLASLMARHGREVLAGADLVVPVPLHWRRKRQRGFNQARDLARGLGLPVIDALVRVRPTVAQVGLTGQARRENVHDAFATRTSAMVGAGSRAPAGARWQRRERAVVVLVDDVATTGATLDACARVLRQAGAREVRALTAARVVS